MDAALIPTKGVRERYGKRSHMWVKRRLEDDSGFPKPVYIGRLRYWRVADLEEWERSLATTFPQASGGPPKRAAKPEPAANDDTGGARAGR